VPPGRKTSVIQQSVTVNHEPGKLTVSGRMVTVDTGAGVRRLVGHGGARHHGHTTPAEPLLRDGVGTIGLRPVPSRFPMAPVMDESSKVPPPGHSRPSPRSGEARPEAAVRRRRNIDRPKTEPD